MSSDPDGSADADEATRSSSEVDADADADAAADAAAKGQTGGDDESRTGAAEVSSSVADEEPRTGTDALPSIDAPRPTDDDRRELAALVPSLDRDAVAIPGLAAAAIGLVLAGGVVGLLGTPIVVALWALAGPIYAATGAALLLGAVIGGDPTAAGVGSWGLGASGISLALVAGGVAWLVVAPVVRDRRSLPVVGATLAAAGATTALVVALRRVASPIATAAALVVAVALAIYVLHRYSLVRLAYRDPQ